MKGVTSFIKTEHAKRKTDPYLIFNNNKNGENYDHNQLLHIQQHNGGHLWKVDNDSEEKGGQNEGCRVQGARVSDVSGIEI